MKLIRTAKSFLLTLIIIICVLIFFNLFVSGISVDEGFVSQEGFVEGATPKKAATSQPPPKKTATPPPPPKKESTPPPPPKNESTSPPPPKADNQTPPPPKAKQAANAGTTKSQDQICKETNKTLYDKVSTYIDVNEKTILKSKSSYVTKTGGLQSNSPIITEISALKNNDNKQCIKYAADSIQAL